MNCLKLILFHFNIELLMTHAGLNWVEIPHEMNQGSIVSFWVSTQSLNVYLDQVIFFENPREYIFCRIPLALASGISEEVRYLMCPLQS